MSEHDNRDPPRWTDSDGDGPHGIADLFRTARTDVPRERLARVGAKLGLDGGGGGGHIGPRARSRFAIPTAIGVGVIAVAIGLGTRNAREPPASAPMQATAPERSAEPARPASDTDSMPVLSDPPSTDEEESRAAPTPRPTRRPRVEARERHSPAPDVNPRESVDTHHDAPDELEMLMAIRAALRRGDPGAALLHLASHDRVFPRGALREEADALRVEALLRLRRFAEMETALSRFRATYPRSAHLRRLEQLIGESSRPAP